MDAWIKLFEHVADFSYFTNLKNYAYSAMTMTPEKTIKYLNGNLNEEMKSETKQTINTWITQSGSLH